MDFVKIRLLWYLMRNPDVSQGIPLVCLLLAIAGGGLFVAVELEAFGSKRGRFRRRPRTSSKNSYNRVQNGGGVDSPGLVSCRHAGLEHGYRGGCSQRPARMPMLKVTFVHLIPHHGYVRDNTRHTRPKTPLALPYRQPRNGVQMPGYWFNF